MKVKNIFLNKSTSILLISIAAVFFASSVFAYDGFDVSGIVTDQDGYPVSFARVEACPPDGIYDWTMTDINGWYIFYNLKPSPPLGGGTPSISIQVVKNDSYTQFDPLYYTYRTFTGSIDNYDILMHHNGITGYVLGDLNKPDSGIDNVNVALSSPDGTAISNATTSTYFGKKGYFELGFDSFTPGQTYTLKACANGQTRQICGAPIEITAPSKEWWSARRDIEMKGNLIVFVHGWGNEKSDYFKAFLDVINGYLDRPGHERKDFDILRFDYESNQFTKDIAGNLNNHFRGMNLDMYQDVYIITHSRGHLVAREAVLLAHGKAESAAPLADNILMDFYLKKVSLISLNPLLGGANAAKIIPDTVHFLFDWCFVRAELDPFGAHQRWLAKDENQLPGRIKDYQVYTVVSDPQLLGIWNELRGTIWKVNPCEWGRRLATLFMKNNKEWLKNYEKERPAGKYFEFYDFNEPPLDGSRERFKRFLGNLADNRVSANQVFIDKYRAVYGAAADRLEGNIKQGGSIGVDFLHIILGFHKDVIREILTMIFGEDVMPAAGQQAQESGEGLIKPFYPSSTGIYEDSYDILFSDEEIRAACKNTSNPQACYEGLTCENCQSTFNLSGQYGLKDIFASGCIAPGELVLPQGVFTKEKKFYCAQDLKISPKKKDGQPSLAAYECLGNKIQGGKCITNLVQDPGAEQAGSPIYWYTHNNMLNNSTGWTGEESYSGEHSLEIVNPFGKNAYWAGPAINLAAPYPSTLTLGGYSKAENVSLNSSRGIYCLDFYIQFEDGTTLWYVPPQLKFSVGTHDWENREITHNFGKPIKSVRPLALLYYGATGTVWFDDLYAYRDNDRTQNLLTNPDMEAGIPLYWYTNYNELNNSTGWVKETSVSGEHSAKIINTQGTNAYWAGQTTNFDPANYPTTLTLGGYSRAENVNLGTRGLYCLDFYIQFADGTAIWYAPTQIRFSGGTHDWENREVTRNFGKPIKSVKPLCLLYYGATGTVWFDDVYVYRGE